MQGKAGGDLFEGILAEGQILQDGGIVCVLGLLGTASESGSRCQSDTALRWPGTSGLPYMTATPGNPGVDLRSSTW